jgi:hypothetical protein
MIKKYTISFTLIVLAVLVGIYVFKMRTNSAKLEDKVINTIKKSETIDFSEILDFEWDKLFIIEPYSDVNLLFNKEGISSPNKDYAIKSYDSIYMLAFIYENQLIQYIDLPTQYIAFVEKMNNPIKFNNEDSEFNISKENVMLISKNNSTIK